MILKMPTAIVKSQRHICATMDDLLWILIRLFHDFQNAKACRITTAAPEVTAVKGLFLCVCVSSRTLNHSIRSPCSPLFELLAYFFIVFDHNWTIMFIVLVHSVQISAAHISSPSGGEVQISQGTALGIISGVERGHGWPPTTSSRTNNW